MGLSGGSKTTTTTGPSPQALPYMTRASSALEGAYAANQPNLNNITQGLSRGFNSFADRWENNPTTDAAEGYVRRTLSDPYSANPQLESIIGQSNNDIVDRINSIFSSAGQTGSSRQIGELGRRLADNESNLRFADYNNWQSRQAAAVPMAAQLGSLDNQGAATLGALGGIAASTPYLGAQILSSGLGNIWGNAQQTTQEKSGGGGLFGNILGSVLGGWAAG